jgi:hypothetical protein
MEWLEPWSGIQDPKVCGRLEAELRRELIPTHVLFGLHVTALAQRVDQDDVLFALEDGRVADVHLTWARHPETDPRWPGTELFPSLVAWVADRMIPDRQEVAEPEGPYPLPPPPDGWFFLAYSVDHNQHLARLSATVDVWGKWKSWRESWVVGSTQGTGRLIADDTRGRIEVFAGSELIDAFEFLLETPLPKFDRLADGRWIVTDARCRPGETNARILAPGGALLSRIHLGDGIAHLQCDSLGGIWVCYFDEGIFGSPASDENGEPPGAYGINRFHPEGTISWSPGPGFYPPIYDCYAMNVGTDGVWVCYYDGFPIVHVPFDGVLRQWRNDAIRGASLVAASGDLAVLLGGYQDEADTGALLRLGDNGRAEVLHRFRLDPTMAAAMRGSTAISRGSEVHFIDGNTWTMITVQDFAEGLASTPPRFPIYVPPPEGEPKPLGPGWTVKPDR